MSSATVMTCHVLAGIAILGVASPVDAWEGSAKEPQPMTVAEDDPKHPFSRRFQLPPEALDGGEGWINSAGPITLPKLRGKIVLLDFWTFCCINCIHVIADLEKLEREFPKELVVVGVHSPKFPGEKDTGNIRSAVVRYEIKHPVVNDAKMKIWRRFGANSWPTLVLIDAQGGAVRMYAGEGNYDQIRDDVKRLIEYHASNNTLDRSSLYFKSEEIVQAETPLRFPGKVIVDAKSNRMAIADSSHHRVVLVDLAGNVQAIIGDGKPGLKDGDYATTRFNDPQGMAFDGDNLWVADRKNHALRKIDLKAKTTTTIAGNGERGYEREPEGAGKAVALASPWDLLIVDGVMYLAMAGTHQIWSMKMAEPGVVRNFSGTGRENIFDGPRAAANFAQPSGLATDGEWLYVADSEISAIRAVGLKKDVVKTLVGEGLFEFGDKDGPGAAARLQHALGVAYHDGVLYVADTYNNKLKTIDKKGVVRTWLGDGKSGRSDKPPRFDEPGGIHVADGKLYVADTNNHLVRIVDLTTKAVSTFELKGLTPPKDVETESWPEGVTPAPFKTARPTGEATFAATVNAPAGTKLNKEAPMRLSVWRVGASGETLGVQSKSIPPGSSKLTATFPREAFADAAKVRVLATFFPCEDGSEGVCKIAHHAWELEFDSTAKAGGTIELPSP
jgi:thiol-disulfide isomerase/thioredoxin